MIDDHVHLWTRSLVRSSESAQAALAYFRASEEDLPRTLDDLVEDLHEASVRKAFLLAMDCGESDQEALRNLTVRNEEVGEAVREHPDLFVGFAGIDPRRSKALDYFGDAIGSLELTGLKFHASAIQVRPDDKQLMYPIYRKAQELQVPIIHHTGTTALGSCLIHYARPIYFDEVAQAFPDVRMLLAHFGWPWMEECFAVLMRNPNLYTDISGWLPKYLPEAMVTMINGPLKERTLVGSDYPMIKPSSWREDFNRSLKPRLKEGVSEKLLMQNALSFLRP
ncbi:MAG: amidohydrolase family protein [Thermoplasmata archaeon]